MQDRPTSSELLATVAAYLEGELLPTLEGPLSYRTRVAANLIRILEREESLGAAALLRERALLCRLLDIDVDDAAVGPLADQVAALNRRLINAIDADRVEHARTWETLLEIARAKLAVIRPGYDSWDARGELP